MYKIISYIAVKYVFAVNKKCIMLTQRAKKICSMKYVRKYLGSNLLPKSNNQTQQVLDEIVYTFLCDCMVSRVALVYPKTYKNIHPYCYYQV